MLLIDVDITTACPKGTNLAETKVIGNKEVNLSNGQKRYDPVQAGVYVSGLQLGDGGPAVMAPIALLPGDHLRVAADVRDPREAQFPEVGKADRDPLRPLTREVYSVARAGKIEWINEELVAADKERAGYVQERVAKNKAAGKA